MTVWLRNKPVSGKWSVDRARSLIPLRPLYRVTQLPVIYEQVHQLAWQDGKLTRVQLPGSVLFGDVWVTGQWGILELGGGPSHFTGSKDLQVMHPMSPGYTKLLFGTRY